MVSYAGQYFGVPFRRFSFTYLPLRKTSAAALNFHLTAKEKVDLRESLHQPVNDSLFRVFGEAMRAMQGADH